MYDQFIPKTYLNLSQPNNKDCLLFCQKNYHFAKALFLYSFFFELIHPPDIWRHYLLQAKK